MNQPPRPRRPWVIYGALLGAIVGSVYGAWTLASLPPDRAVAVSQAAPPAVSRCPEGYARDPALDGSVVLEGTHARWLARCDPTRSQSAVSESIELLYAGEIYLDARVRGEVLTEFVRGIAHSSRLLLDPLPPVSAVTIDETAGIAMDTDAAFRVPALTMRLWLLPAGGNTVQVTLVAPRARFERALAATRHAIETTTGLRAWDSAAHGERGWSVAVTCPVGFSDATPANGGEGQSAYVGRYCLSPDADGGTELTFAELPASASDAGAQRRLFELASVGTSALGVVTGAGFGPSEPVTFGSAQGVSAVMELDPPAARLHVRALMLPAGTGTVYGLSMSTTDHASVARAALEQWMSATVRPRAYDPAALTAYRRTRATKVIVVPGLITALLGALIAWLIARGTLDLGE